MGTKVIKLGYKDDPIFLLSVDEFNLREFCIPEKKMSFWLRDVNKDIKNSKYIFLVKDTCTKKITYDLCNKNCYAVLPALKTPEFDFSNNVIGESINYRGLPVTIIGKHTVIMNVPICFSKFCDIDEEIDYEKSFIRKYLLKWYEENVNCKWKSII